MDHLIVSVMLCLMFGLHCVDPCYDEDYFLRREICAESTGFNETHCANLDCYMACVESFLTDCMLQPEFWYRDSLVFRVTTRVKCIDKEYYALASRVCHYSLRCSVEDQLLVQSLFENTQFLKNMGDFERSKNMSCLLYSYMIPCFRVDLTDECTEPMAAYMNDFYHLEHLKSECEVEQDTPLYLRHGTEVNCETNATGEFESNSTTTNPSTEGISTTPTQSPPTTITTTMMTEANTMPLSEYVASPTTPMTKATAASTQSYVVSSSVSTSSLPDALTISTETTRLTTGQPMSVTFDRSVTTIGILTTSTESTLNSTTEPMKSSCTSLALSFKFAMAGCPMNISYEYNSVQEAKEHCKNMECKLDCFDEVVQDCDEHNYLFSKLRHRILLRMLCNATESGFLEEVMDNSIACYTTRCYQVYWTLLLNATHHDIYCRYFPQFKRCPFHIITNSCPQHISDWIKLHTLTYTNICNPEDSPLVPLYNYTDYQCLFSVSALMESMLYVEISVIVMFGHTWPYLKQITA